MKTPQSAAVVNAAARPALAEMNVIRAPGSMLATTDSGTSMVNVEVAVDPEPIDVTDIVPPAMLRLDSS